MQLPRLTKFDSGDLKLIESIGEGFLEHYVAFASAHTDAPVEYHFGCGFGLMSSVIGRQAIELLFKSHPNLWILLLGPTTIFRKTTSLRIANRLLRRFDRDCLIASDFSPQSLLGAVAERQGGPAVFFRDETSGLFRAITRHGYMAGMSETLIKLFDGDSCSRKLRKEEIIVEEPYLVWFGGAITEKLLGAVGEEEVFSGLMVRFILINPLKKGPFKPLTYATAEETWKEDDLIQRLKSIQDHLRTPWSLSLTQGSGFFQGDEPYYFILTAAALDRFNTYVRMLEDEGLGDPIVEKINSRTGPLALKLMMLLACDHWDVCSHSLNTVLVGLDILLKSLYFAELFRLHSVRTLSQIGDTDRERNYDRIVDFIKAHPGITRGKLMRRFKLNAREMSETRQTLIERGLITIRSQRTGSRGKEAEVYFHRKPLGETQEETQ